MSSWTKWGLSLLVAIALIWVGWRMTFILVTLHVAVCFILVIVIMLQRGSGVGGSIRGSGQSGRVWSARCGDVPIPRYHLVCHRLYDDLAYLVSEARSLGRRWH